MTKQTQTQTQTQTHKNNSLSFSDKKYILNIHQNIGVLSG